MARPLRIEYEGAVYHVTARGNARRRIFFTESDYKKFISYLSASKKKFKVNMHCYALMGNHYHLIIETPKANLSKAMHFINSSYTAYINRKQKRSGHLFQGRYKSIIVDADSYLLELSRYIHLNPVRAGMVQKPGNYQFSSYRAFVKNKKEEVLTKELVLGLVSSRNGKPANEYQMFVESSIAQETKSPLENVYGGCILGGPVFIKEVLKRIRDDFHSNDGILNRKALMATSGVDEVAELVSDYYNIDRDKLAKSKSSEQRNIAIFLMKEYTGITNGEIGDFFEGLSSEAVRKVYQRFKKETGSSRKLRRQVLKIEKQMSRVRG